MNEQRLVSEVQMLTQLLDEERATNASMSAVRATMQEHGLSISDILLLQSQNQFLQSELQVNVARAAPPVHADSRVMQQYLASLTEVEDTMAKQMAQIKDLQARSWQRARALCACCSRMSCCSCKLHRSKQMSMPRFVTCDV